MLFADTPEFELIRREQPLQLPPKPPQPRKWRGSIVAPFGGNNILVLYSCPANNSSKYLVQVLHNEHPVLMPVSFLWLIVEYGVKFLLVSDLNYHSLTIMYIYILVISFKYSHVHTTKENDMLEMCVSLFLSTVRGILLSFPWFVFMRFGSSGNFNFCIIPR